MTRRFPSPWNVEPTPGDFKVLDATGQARTYVYARETKADAMTAKVLTTGEPRPIAAKYCRVEVSSSRYRACVQPTPASV